MKSTELFPNDLFADQTVFITGGGSGINFGIARHFAGLGANVAICSRNMAKLEAAAEQLARCGSGRMLPVAADVRDANALAAALARSEAELGPAKVVVSGAAGNFLCEAEKLSPNGFRTVVDIDLNGSFNVARLAFDQLRSTHGSLIFITAGLSYIPYTHQVHAAAAKAGIDNMMKNLALEWGRYGIRSNSIAPGYVSDTEGTMRLAGGPVLDAVIRTTPLSRLVGLDDIANAAVYLSSPLAACVTGTVLVVDCGHYLEGSAMLNAEQRRISAASGAA